MSYLNYLLLAILSFASIQANAQSSVKFRISNAGFTVPGSFSDFKTDVNYDRSSPSKSRFNGTVMVTSVNTKNKKRDKHLRNEDFFHVSKWPRMTFRSTSVKPNGSSKLRVTGKLTIKDVTKTVTFDVKVSKRGSKDVFDTTLKINRRHYNVGGWYMTLANELYIDLHIEK